MKKTVVEVVGRAGVLLLFVLMPFWLVILKASLAKDQSLDLFHMLAASGGLMVVSATLSGYGLYSMLWSSRHARYGITQAALLMGGVVLLFQSSMMFAFVRDAYAGQLALDAERSATLSLALFFSTLVWFVSLEISSHSGRSSEESDG